MPVVSSPISRRPASCRVAFVAATLLVLVIGLPVAAQSPVPEASMAATPAPTLTFAPLVTLPPIVIPAARDTAGLEDGYAIGSPDAPVTMEVWEDFQCPYCLRWTAQIEPQVMEAFVKPGLVRLTYRPMAFLGEESQCAAVAADIAAEQNRFWPLHDLFFANQRGENVGSFGLDRILEMAQAAGLDMDALTAGLQLDAARARYATLEAASRAGATALGIQATPSVVVNGALLASPDFATISAAVAQALGAGTSPAASPVASPATSPADSPAS